MTELGSWQPVQGTHAIQLAALTFTFGEPIGDIAWRRAVSAVQVIAAELGLVEQAPVGLSLPPELIALGLTSPMQHGVAFVRREEAGEYGERLIVSREQIRFEDYSYVRWSPFKARARKLLGSLLMRFADVSSVTSMINEYVDVFRAREEGTAPDISEVVSPASPYVAARAFSSHEAWHSHIGWFEPSPDTFKRIANTNIDVNDVELWRQVRIWTKTVDLFSNIDIDDLTSRDWSSFEDQIETSHIALKKMLREILTAEAAQAVSLG